MLKAAVLRLLLLNEDMAVFMGESEESREIVSFFGSSEQKFRFPSLQISREMWEAFDRPTVISISTSRIS